MTFQFGMQISSLKKHSLPSKCVEKKAHSDISFEIFSNVHTIPNYVNPLPKKTPIAMCLQKKYFHVGKCTLCVNKIHSKRWGYVCCVAKVTVRSNEIHTVRLI